MEIQNVKNLESKLKSLHALVDCVSESILVVGKDNRIRFANASAGRFLGRPPTDLIGCSFGYPLVRGKVITIRTTKTNGQRKTFEIHVDCTSWAGEPSFQVRFKDISEKMVTESRLRIADNKYRSLFHKSREPMFIVSREGKILEFNRAMLHLFGYSKEEFGSLATPNIYVDPEDRIDFQVAMATRCWVKDYPVELRKRNGNRIDCQISATPIIGEDFSVFGYQGVLRNVTHERRQEEALIAERFKLKSFFQKMPVAAFQVDLEGFIIDCNILALDYFRAKTKGQLLGIPIVDLIVGAKGEEDIEKVMGQISSNHPLSDKTLRISDGLGGTRDILFSCETICDHRRVPLFRLCTVLDVSELTAYRHRLLELVNQQTEKLKRALRETQEARDRTDGILKSIVDGIIVTDINQRIILMNPAAERLIGVSLNQVINLPIDVTIDDPLLLKEIKAFLKNCRSGDFQDFTKAYNNTDKTEIIRASASSIKHKRGHDIGIVTLLQDVSQEMKLARLKNEFISTATHELRTPLTTILAFSEILMIRENIDETEKRKFLYYINNKAIHLNKLLNEMLNLSRIESGYNLALNRVRTDFSSIICRNVNLFRSMVTNHEIQLDLPSNPIFLEVDALKMEQVIENLISNSIKYSPMGGLIRIQAHLKNQFCIVGIEDRGIGMTPGEVEHIFDKFYRADATNTAISGTGLGMSIVHAIIAGHQGDITVESQKGSGTKVTLILPATNSSVI